MKMYEKASHARGCLIGVRFGDYIRKEAMRELAQIAPIVLKSGVVKEHEDYIA
jgi:hypothetical protein